MEQRLLRLGDNVDDYCPRERRITNHAVVAIVENAIRQTRCTTCDAEHVYKHGKEPRKRKKDEPATAFEEVLADLTGGNLVPARPQPPATPEAAAAAAPEPAPLAAADAAEETQLQPEPPAHTDTWLAHRQLIRASLPKTEGELPPPRPIPEFTMHQRPVSRGGHFRHAYGRDGNMGGGGHFRGRGNGSPNANGNGNGGFNGNGNGNGPAPNGGRPGKSGRRRHRHKQRPR